jgi:hypothetical protein
MKTHKHWRIENGQVVKCGPFDSLAGAIRANTKAEAIALFLARADSILSNPPRVYVCNGAFLIVSHNGNGFTCESGVLSNSSTPKPLQSSCISAYDTLAAAIGDKTFAYYASEEYRQMRATEMDAML